jgi:uncharacterized protein
LDIAMPYMFFDPTMILLIPPLLLAMWAQMRVKSTYARYSQVEVASGLTGAQVAQYILEDAGVAGEHACSIEYVEGNLTDHYDPRSQTLRLSRDVYHGQNIAALGVAAHEVGHAIQDTRSYAPLRLRGFMYPMSSLGSSLAFPIFFVGMFMGPGLGKVAMTIAILMFGLSVLFTLVTLPVEFDASRRALVSLERGNYLNAKELGGAKKVLSAAALTYVAAAAMALMNLVRMILITQNRR